MPSRQQVMICQLRGFSQNAPRKLQKITSMEYEVAVTSLVPKFDSVVSIRLPLQRSKSVFFIKKKQEEIAEWQSAICSLDCYTEKFNCPMHWSVTNSIHESNSSKPGTCSRKLFCLKYIVTGFDNLNKLYKTKSCF